MNKIIFIGWDGFDQRNQAYCDILNAKHYFIGKHEKAILKKIFSWFEKSWKSYLVIKKEKPQIVIIKNTHFVIGLSHLIIKFLLNFKLIFDSHSESFDNNMFLYPAFLHKYFVKFIELSIVTNEKEADLISSWGGRVHIVRFPPIKFNKEIFRDWTVNKEKFNICYINTYSNDEPYDEVIDAVRYQPNIHLYITGNFNKRKNSIIILENVTHTGFISRNEYLGLLNNVDAIMVLTNRDNTMQKGGNEAIFLDKPIITSDLPFLRKYFKYGTVYVKLNSVAILNGIKEMNHNIKIYSEQIKHLHDEVEFINKKDVLKITSKII